MEYRVWSVECGVWGVGAGRQLYGGSTHCKVEAAEAGKMAGR